MDFIKVYIFGCISKKIRQSKGVTQEELAEKIGTSQIWIAYIEIGRNKPNLAIFEKTVKALGVKTKDLIPF